MKITKDKYFMELAKVCATRSLDEHSQFGCVAVSKDGSVLSTGYNGPPRGVDDSAVPLTRPAKYTYMEHSERNCIYNAARIGIPLEGCTFYVTGVPCLDCLRGMYQVGAKRVCCMPKQAKMLRPEDAELIKFLSKYMEIEIWN